jgi:L-iditol 2-dehydrogenase
MMKALTFTYSVPRYLLTGALAHVWPRILFSPFAPVQVKEIPEPALPGPAWVKIRPRLAGFCGSDLSIVLCRESLSLQPFASYPFVFGHEVCGEIADKGEGVLGFENGERVAVIPTLGCIPRGIEPPCRMCAQGKTQLCEKFTQGRLAPGMFAGTNADVPGYISERGLAHASQLVKVPEGVSDENIVMAEPFSTVLHMVVNNPIQAGETVLVFGCGVMGLCTIAALKTLHPACRVLAVEPDPFHSAIAKDMGVEEVMVPGGGKALYRRIADLTGAKMFTPLLAKPLLIGGVHRVFDAVGSTQTIETSLRILANGGWFNLLGIAQPGRIDWTPVWLKELTLRGIYAYQVEHVQGEKIHTFDLAMRLYHEGKVDLSHLVTHRFRLDQWHQALEVALHKGRHKAVKVVFTQ